MTEPFEIRLVFTSEKDAKDFVAAWLDGGGEYTCGFDTVYAQSDKWDRHTPKWLLLRRVEED